MRATAEEVGLGLDIKGTQGLGWSGQTQSTV